MYQVRNDQLIAVTSNAQIQTAYIDCTALDRCTLQAVYAGVSQSAAVFASASKINFATGVFTKTAHGLVTGTVGQFTTSVTLPSGLSTSTDYYVIRLTADTLQFATTLANAVAGTALTISDAGSGNQTFTPAALSGVLKVSGSNSPTTTGATWTDLPNTTVTISGSANTIWSSSAVYIASSVTTPQLDVGFKWLRVLYTPTSGALDLTVTVNAASTTRC